MKIATAIHQIIRKPEPIEPGDVFEFENYAFDELLKLGAIREATEDEVQLYRMSKGEPELPLKEEKAAEEAKAAEERAALEARAKQAGVSIDKRWGDARLLDEVVKAEAAKANPDPEVKDL